jgi:hypothetical protein
MSLGELLDEIPALYTYGANCSWEPVENVHDCTRLVNSFWDHVGPDNKDYMAGYEVHAKKWWISKLHINSLISASHMMH